MPDLSPRKAQSPGRKIARPGLQSQRYVSEGGLEPFAYLTHQGEHWLDLNPEG